MRSATQRTTQSAASIPRKAIQRHTRPSALSRLVESMPCIMTIPAPFLPLASPADCCSARWRTCCSSPRTTRAPLRLPYAFRVGPDPFPTVFSSRRGNARPSTTPARVSTTPGVRCARRRAAAVGRPPERRSVRSLRPPAHPHEAVDRRRPAGLPRPPLYRGRNQLLIIERRAGASAGTHHERQGRPFATCT
jgi:hypothetical protein